MPLQGDYAPSTSEWARKQGRELHTDDIEITAEPKTDPAFEPSELLATERTGAGRLLPGASSAKMSSKSGSRRRGPSRRTLGRSR